MSDADQTCQCEDIVRPEGPKHSRVAKVIASAAGFIGKAAGFAAGVVVGGSVLVALHYFQNAVE